MGLNWNSTNWTHTTRWLVHVNAAAEHACKKLFITQLPYQILKNQKEMKHKKKKRILFFHSSEPQMYVHHVSNPVISHIAREKVEKRKV